MAKLVKPIKKTAPKVEEVTTEEADLVVEEVAEEVTAPAPVSRPDHR